MLWSNWGKQCMSAGVTCPEDPSAHPVPGCRLKALQLAPHLKLQPRITARAMVSATFLDTFFGHLFRTPTPFQRQWSPPCASPPPTTVNRTPRCRQCGQLRQRTALPRSSFTATVNSSHNGLRYAPRRPALLPPCGPRVPHTRGVREGFQGKWELRSIPDHQGGDQSPKDLTLTGMLSCR